MTSTISAARLAGAGWGVEAQGRGPEEARGAYRTQPWNYVRRGCCSASTSTRIGAESSRSSQVLRRRRRRRSSGDDGSLRIGAEASLGGCRSGGELFRLRGGRQEQSIVAVTAAVRGFVDECPLFRYASGIRSQLSSASCCSVFALGMMRSRRDGWKRAGALEQQQRRKNSYTRGAFADDDDNNSGASLMNNGNSDKIVPPPSLPATKLLTLPTILTLARVAAVPAILAVFYCKETWATAAGVAIFIIAAVTDWLDGYLARKMGSSSAFGAFLDPVADKLMVAAALVLLCTRPLPVSGFATIPWLLPLPTIAIIGREITMSAVREWAAAQGADVLKAVAVNNLGKIKTAAQMIAITLLLATGDGGLDSKIASYLGIALLYVATALALWSLALYMKGIWGFLCK